jgi:hypothetical protein
MRMTNKVYMDVPLRELCSQSSYQLTALYLGTSTHMTSGGTPYVLPPHLEQKLSFTGLRTKDWNFSTLQELGLFSGPT